MTTLSLDARNASDPASATEPVYRFSLRAVADPSVLPRVVELFTLRDLIPMHVECRLVRPEQPELRVDVAVSGLAPNEAEHLAVRMRQFPTVLSVLMERSSRPATEARRLA